MQELFGTPVNLAVTIIENSNLRMNDTINLVSPDAMSTTESYRTQTTISASSSDSSESQMDTEEDNMGYVFPLSPSPMQRIVNRTIVSCSYKLTYDDEQ